MGKKNGVELKVVRNFKKDLDAGVKGLKISFLILLVIVIVSYVILLFQVKAISVINSVIFRAPSGKDYLVLFAGVILFIVVPFALAIKITKKK